MPRVPLCRHPGEGSLRARGRCQPRGCCLLIPPLFPVSRGGSPHGTHGVLPPCWMVPPSKGHMEKARRGFR